MFHLPNLCRYCILIIAWAIILPYVVTAQNMHNNTHTNGFSIEFQNQKSMTIRFQIPNYEIHTLEKDGFQYNEIMMDGSFLPNQKGAPNLPHYSRTIAVPKNAIVKIEYSVLREEMMEGMEIAPSCGLPLQTETMPATISKDQNIYNCNQWYPEKEVTLSETTQIRGVDVVQLGIFPFQYNPKSKKLRVINELSISLSFSGGDGSYVDERLRSRWWDPIIQGIVANGEVLSESSSITYPCNETGCEYLIITPDNADFLHWADSIKTFRTQQGIITEIVTTIEMGGNTANAIEAYIDNAYQTWDIPPAAILLLGDHGADAMSIISPTIPHPYAGSCLSDNKYADVDEDGLPDITISRITARDATELESTIMKFINYERNPPLSSDFYQNPIVISGWEDYSWFQICSETMVGFFDNTLGKSSVRINQIYDGNPTSGLWATVPGTETLLSYFGPRGLNYIPDSPAGLSWTGGNGSQITEQINNGSFLTFYDDHGNVDSWGCPAYGMFQVRNLENTAPTFVFSLGCSTGKFDHYPECFAEAFHRQEKGALSIIASTELAYKLVNEVYHWGTTDYLWPDFMPDYNTEEDHNFLLTAFASTYGKYFLATSEWPYNYYEKEITYHLFHHHGDAFSAIHSEVPLPITVTHDEELLMGTGSFSVIADVGALVAITANGQIFGVEESTGEAILFEFDPLTTGTTLTVTATQKNHIRYSANVQVVDNPTVINENEKNHEIHISPNPTNDKITISTSEAIGDVEIKIYNSSMDLIQSQKTVFTRGSEEIIRMNRYESGIYFIIIQSANTIWAERILLQL